MDGVIIRLAASSDATAIRAIYAPIVETTAISFEEAAPTLEEMAGRISASLVFLVADRGGEVLGYAYAGKHRERAAYKSSVDVTVYVADTARRLGVGTMLYADLLPRLKRAGFHAAFAGIALPNPASVRLHEAAGFSPVGVYREVGFKFGRFHDVGWWQQVLA